MYNCSSNEMLVVEILLTWHCQSLYALVIDYEDVSMRGLGLLGKGASLCGYLNTYMYLCMISHRCSHRILLIMDIRY